MREFESGATRDSDEGKPDYEAYLSPRVIRRFGEYMLKHSATPNGKREGDNWQKGFGLPVTMKSMWRHFMDVWVFHRGAGRDEGGDQQEALCALIFNASAYLHQLLEDETHTSSLLLQKKSLDNKLGLQTQTRGITEQMLKEAVQKIHDAEYRPFVEVLPPPVPNTEPCELPPDDCDCRDDHASWCPLNREAQRVQGEPDPAWPSNEYLWGKPADPEELPTRYHSLPFPKETP